MPFLHFRGQASHVLPVGALRAKHLPVLAFVAPDRYNAHDCSLATADRFLSVFAAPARRVAAVALGTAVARHVVSGAPCSHYRLLATVEDALGIGRLGASARARPARRHLEALTPRAPVIAAGSHRGDDRETAAA